MSRSTDTTTVEAAAPTGVSTTPNITPNSPARPNEPSTDLATIDADEPRVPTIRKNLLEGGVEPSTAESSAVKQNSSASSKQTWHSVMKPISNEQRQWLDPQSASAVKANAAADPGVPETEVPASASPSATPSKKKSKRWRRGRPRNQPMTFHQWESRVRSMSTPPSELPFPWNNPPRRSALSPPQSKHPPPFPERCPL